MIAAALRHVFGKCFQEIFIRTIYCLEKCNNVEPNDIILSVRTFLNAIDTSSKVFVYNKLLETKLLQTMHQ